jgi:hypothetical protein
MVTKPPGKRKDQNTETTKRRTLTARGKRMTLTCLGKKTLGIAAPWATSRPAGRRHGSACGANNVPLYENGWLWIAIGSGF